jgi:2-haloacid dehalogenase
MIVRALLFDTYGTVLDWRGSVLAELRAFGARHALVIDWERFLDEWKAGYRAGMDRVNSGEWPWTTVEQIYARRLEEVLAAHHLALQPEDVTRLNHAWWRLHPWPDAIEGLTRLRTVYVVSPLSNASFAGMVRLAKFAGLPWDCIITAEQARCYKPRPEVYLKAIELLALPAEEIMMVAAHNYDLRAARAHGMRTAFVPRPTEYGPGQTTDLRPEEAWDVVATDLVDLAHRLDAA